MHIKIISYLFGAFMVQPLCGMDELRKKLQQDMQQGNNKMADWQKTFMGMEKLYTKYEQETQTTNSGQALLNLTVGVMQQVAKNEPVAPITVAPITAVPIKGKIRLYFQNDQHIAYAGLAQHKATAKMITSYQKNGSLPDITVPLVPVLISLENTVWTDDIPSAIKQKMNMTTKLPCPWAIPVTLFEKKEGTFFDAEEEITLDMYGFSFELTLDKNFNSLGGKIENFMSIISFDSGYSFDSYHWFANVEGQDITEKERVKIQSYFDDTSKQVQTRSKLDCWTNRYVNRLKAEEAKKLQEKELAEVVAAAEKQKKEKEQKEKEQKEKEEAERKRKEEWPVEEMDKKNKPDSNSQNIEEKITHKDRFAWTRNYSPRLWFFGPLLIGATLLICCKACNYDIMSFFKMAW